MGPANPASGIRIKRFGTAQRPIRPDERRRLAWLARSVVVVAQAADILVNGFPARQIGPAGGRLVQGQFGCRPVGRIDLGLEPAAVLIEINHAPVKQQEQQDDEPDGHRDGSGLGLGFRRDRQGSLRFRAHLAEAFVVAALVGPVAGTTGAFVGLGVAAMPGVVRGAEKSGASARRLVR